MKLRYTAAFTAFSITLISAKLNAQTSIPTNVLVSQNFNSMGSGLSLPANWRVSAAGGGSTSTWATGLGVVTQAANSGTPATGGVITGEQPPVQIGQLDL